MLLMPQQLLCAVIEKVANKAITLNIHGNQALETLQLKTLSLHIAELNFPISLTFQSGKVLVTSLSESSDCTIFTSISTLISLSDNQALTELIKQDKLDIQGDIKVAQQVADFAENLKIDWESEIASQIGDIPTHKLKQLGDKLFAKAKFAQQQISADSSEWVLHEAKLVANGSEITHFCQQVTKASEHLQTLEARIAKLSQHLIKT